MRPFDQLTERGQARRLLTLARQALTQYPLDVRRVALLSMAYNTMFRVETPERTYVLRINGANRRTNGEIDGEMRWLAALRRDTDLRVAEAVANCDGGYVTEVEYPGVPDKRQIAVFGWVPGKNLAREMKLEHWVEVGRIAARLHEHAATFPVPSGMEKANVLMDEGDPESNWIFNPANRDHLPAEAAAIIDPAKAAILDELAALYSRTDEAPRILHYDLHAGNMRIYRGKLSVIDFDDTRVGYPVQDVGITLFYLESRPEVEELRAAYRQGYESIRAWPEAFPGHADLFSLQRGLDVLNFLLQSPLSGMQALLPRYTSLLTKSWQRVQNGRQGS